MRLRYSNPYSGSGTRWLRGEIHTHVCKAIGSSETYKDGVSARTIYKAAQDECLDFVCMSVDVTHANGGVKRFGDVGSGRSHNVTGIPAREIQNNYYGGESHDDYFVEPGSDYLHVLTILPGGMSICLHPRYYEMANKKSGGCWENIRSALLHPIPAGRLAKLKVAGIEVYNGFTLDRLQHKGKEHEYSGYDESCWDDMLKRGWRYWGFAGNDSFFNHDDTFKSFHPLGTVYAAVESGHAKEDIVAALKRGCFYSSAGVKLAEAPITVKAEGNNLIVEVSASTAVNWKAKVFELQSRGWCLTSYTVPNTAQATFVINRKWKYVRVQCECVKDPWQRAWLQPITNKDLFCN